MRPSPAKLADLLDSWAGAGRAAVIETGAEVLVKNLTLSQAQELFQFSDEASLHTVAVDTGGEETGIDGLVEAFAPFEMRISKPTGGYTHILTATALRDWLRNDRRDGQSVLAIPGIDVPVDTLSMRLAPWGDESEFIPTRIDANPRKLVRETGDSRMVVSDLSPWLLRDQDLVLNAPSPHVQAWCDLSAVRLTHCLADEVDHDGRFSFRGPPVVRFGQATGMKRLEPVDFRSLQTLAMWVYDNNSDAETRRSLVAAEIARSAFPDEEPARIAALAPNFLEGARIAHQVGLNKVSLDTLRALADLRKTVSDETARFSEATRQLSTSVAGAVFTGIGVMAARLSLPVEGTAFSVAVFVVGVVLLLYVWAVIWNGYRFMAIQKQLRLDWRQRLYRYLQKEEYDLLVTSPAESAERAYTWAARFAIAIAVFLLLGLSVVAFSDAFSAALRGEAMTDLPVTGTSAAP